MFFAKKKKQSSQWTLLMPILLALFTFFITSLVYLKQSFRQKEKPSADNINSQVNGSLINLPSPDYSSKVSLEQTLKHRLTRHNFTKTPLKIKQISQLLWAAQGITTDWGNKTTESYKSEYPLVLYLISDNIKGLDKGFYQYLSGKIDFLHQLKPILVGPVKAGLLGQIDSNSFATAPAVIIISADLTALSQFFPDNPQMGRYLIYLETGYVIQNLYLQSESLGLGVVENLNFDKQPIKSKLKLPNNLAPLALISIGNPQD